MKLNKLLSSLLAVTLFLGFSSCSNDDDDVNNSIIGTWSFIKVEADAAATSDLNEIKSLLEEEDFFQKVTFNSNNTFHVFAYDEEPAVDGTYTYQNNTLTMYWDVDDPEDTDTYTATVFGNSLKIADDNTDDFKKYEFPNSGVTKAIAIFHFTRQ